MRRIFRAPLFLLLLVLGFGLVACEASKEEKKADSPKAAGAKGADKTADKTADKGKKGEAVKKGGDKVAPAPKKAVEKKVAEFKPDPVADKAADQLLGAMKVVSGLIAATPKDPKKALADIKVYLDTNDASLKTAMAAVRKYYDGLPEDDAESFRSRHTNREEYQEWASTSEAFEEQYPDDFGTLEEMMDPIQSAGVSEPVAENLAPAGDNAAALGDKGATPTGDKAAVPAKKGK